MNSKYNFWNGLKNLIKKYFFNCDKNDICQSFDQSVSMPDSKVSNHAEMEVEEYMKNYQSTTRWQTV